MTICPNCGHHIEPKTRRTAAPPAPIDTSTLSNAALYAHFKRTAPVEDTRFFLTTSGHTLTADEHVELEGLIACPPNRAEHYRRLRRVMVASRQRANIWGMREPNEYLFFQQVRFRAHSAPIRAQVAAYREFAIDVRRSIRTASDEECYTTPNAAATSTRLLVQKARELYGRAACFQDPTADRSACAA